MKKLQEYYKVVKYCIIECNVKNKVENNMKEFKIIIRN